MQDVGRTQEEFLNYKPQASDLEIHRVNLTSQVVSLNHRNLWSIA